jgi:hypothetical protein
MLADVPLHVSGMAMTALIYDPEGYRSARRWRDRTPPGSCSAGPPNRMEGGQCSHFVRSTDA